jgi:immune inhibitor A
MKANSVRHTMIVVVVLLCAITALNSAQLRAPTRQGLSVYSLDPDIITSLRAQGHSLPDPGPKSKFLGVKFDPGGEVIPPLSLPPEQNVLVLFVEFTTTPPGAPEARLNMSYFDDLLFGDVYDPPEYAAYPDYPTNRTLKNYYQEVSYGHIQVGTNDLPSELTWVSSGKPYEYYCLADGVHDNAWGPYPNNAQGLVIDAIIAADPYVDFSQYAVNGEVPNLFVTYAGTGAEWSGDPSLIWSHSWSLDAGTNLKDGYTADGVILNNYAMVPEIGGDLTGYAGETTGPFPPTVGVYAHEFGHVLGLPDQYDYGYESYGTGMYSLMANGSWNRYPNELIFSGNSPAHLDAWSKYRLGFIDPVEISEFETISLPPVEQEPLVYKMAVPNSGGKEYFLFENRQQVGFDLGFSRRGEELHGLAIYHIDDTVLNRNYWNANEAENWLEYRFTLGILAWNGERHYAVSIIQADDQWDLEHGVWGDFLGDLYPGINAVTEFSSYTFPNSTSHYYWEGNEPRFGYSGVTVENILEEGWQISANFSLEPWEPPASQ